MFVWVGWSLGQGRRKKRRKSCEDGRNGQPWGWHDTCWAGVLASGGQRSLFSLLPDLFMQVESSWGNQAANWPVGRNFRYVRPCSVAGRGDVLGSEAKGWRISAFYQQGLGTPSFLRWNHRIPPPSCQGCDSSLSHTDIKLLRRKLEQSGQEMNIGR